MNGNPFGLERPRVGLLVEYIYIYIYIYIYMYIYIYIYISSDFLIKVQQKKCYHVFNHLYKTLITYS